MKVVALAGGVGGAKLVDGLAACLPAEDLTVIVNNGDDFNLFGLYICPDLDTVCYTLAGFANEKTGWGQKDETWRALEWIGRLNGPTWFKLGDGDIGLHLERTRRLSSGEKISEVTRSICKSLGIEVTVLPMADQKVSTIVKTREFGELSFQDYFVRYQCEPKVIEFRFEGIAASKAPVENIKALEKADCIIICPSNPWVSIDPIIHVPLVYDYLKEKITIAVSPLINGKTIKGPAAKMFREMNIEPSAMEVARHYKNILNGFVLDKADCRDSDIIKNWNIMTFETDIIMSDRSDRRRFAKEILDFYSQIRERFKQ